MKFVLLLTLLAGCSFIKIEENTESEKRPFLTAIEYLCNDGSKECEYDDSVRISIDKIEFYEDDVITKDVCDVKLLGIGYAHKLKMSCSDFDKMLNR